MKTQKYRLAITNGFGTLSEMIGDLTLSEALSDCVKLCHETVDADYLKNCELDNWIIEGTAGRQPLHSSELGRADICLSVMPIGDVNEPAGITA